jgi:DNA-binding protein YbaB
MTQQITKLTEQLKQQTYKTEYLEKELVRVKLQGEQRLSEIDKLYKENDKYRADLSFISL